MIDSPKGLAMEGAAAEFLDGLEVFLGAVAFVAGEIIFGIFFVVGHHEAIAGNLGYNRGCRDRKALLIPLYYGHLREGNLQGMEAINQKKIRSAGKIGHRFFHGF